MSRFLHLVGPLTELNHSTAETYAASLEASLSRLDNDHPDIQQHIIAETEVRQQLADVKKQLEKYQSIYGNSSSSTPEVKRLSSELQKKEEEVQKLRLLDTQRGEVNVQAPVDFYCSLADGCCRLRHHCTQNLISSLLHGRLSTVK